MPANSENENKTSGSPSTALFAVELATAVSNMWTNFRGNVAREAEVMKRIQASDRQEIAALHVDEIPYTAVT